MELPPRFEVQETDVVEALLTAIRYGEHSINEAHDRQFAEVLAFRLRAAGAGLLAFPSNVAAVT